MKVLILVAVVVLAVFALSVYADKDDGPKTFSCDKDPDSETTTDAPKDKEKSKGKMTCEKAKEKWVNWGLMKKGDTEISADTLDEQVEKRIKGKNKSAIKSGLKVCQKDVDLSKDESCLAFAKCQWGLMHKYCDFSEMRKNRKKGKGDKGDKAEKEEKDD